MDRFDAMRVLVGAVEAGSLSAAARTLGMTLPTVSRRISELEQRLGARLLRRTTRSLSLTDAGEAYVAACRRILDEVGEAERAAAGEFSQPKGDLLVAAPIVFGRLHVLPAVTAFLARHPEVRVQLALSDRNQPLIEDHIDAAVRIGRLADSGLRARRLGTVRRVVCASPAFLSRHGTPKAPEDLARLPCIAFERSAGMAAWQFGSGSDQRSVIVQPRLTVNTAEAALDAALDGTGITRVLSYQAAAGVAAGTLRVLLRRFEPEPLPVSLLHADQRPLPAKLRAFLDFAGPILRDRLAAI